MKKSFMTRVLATGLSLAMAFSLTAATNVSTAEAAAMMKSSSVTVTEGKVVKAYMTSSQAKKYRIKSFSRSAEAKKYIKVAILAKKTGVAIRALDDAVTNANLEKATVKVKLNFVKAASVKAANKAKKPTKSVKVKVVVKAEKLSVAGVTATNGTTLTVTGTKLGDLVAADITVAGNVVSSYTAAEDGKTATIKLASSLVPDEDTKVTIKGVDYTVKYSITADTVAIKDNSVDNNTKNQYLAITANGADSSVSDLVANGYTVRFESYKADGMTAYNLLDTDNNSATQDAASTNNSGLIANPAGGLELGTYKACIILTKGNSIIKSDFATITVIDQDTLTTAINSVEGTLSDTNASIVKSTGNITLVNGEVLTINKAEYVNDGKTYTSTSFTTANTSLATSNKAVASVTLADANIKITASSVGTSTVTITFGKVSKTFNVTVVNVARAAKSIVVKDAPAKIVNGLSDNKYTYYVVDNHGAYTPTQEVVAEISSGASNITFGTSTGTVDSDGAGIATFDITATGAGTATVDFYFGDGTGNKTGSSLRQSSITVVTTDNVTTGFKEVAIDAEGYVQKDTITTLDKNPLAARSKALILQYTEYANGVVSGAAAVTNTAIIKYDSRLVTVYGHTSKPSASLPANLTPTDAGAVVTDGSTLATGTYKYFTVIVNGAVDGTPNTTVAIWNAAKTSELAKATVTVTDTTPRVTGGTLKMTSIGNTNMNVNLDNVLNIGADNSVSGLTIANAPVGLKLYIDKSTGELYYSNSGAADSVAQHHTVGFVKVGKNTGNFNDSNLATVNALYTLTSSATVNVVASDQGTINVYVAPTTTTAVDTTSTCIGTITVD